jgi:glycosyltransferase involved in cell wall biosynthesis
MIKVFIINSVYNKGSTGKIVYQIQKLLQTEENECVVAYKYGKIDKISNNVYEINGWWDAHIHSRIARWTGLRDSFSLFHTMALVHKMKNFNPDVIHLHLIQENYINVRVLFKYLNRCGKPIIWTFHDCRAFTGGCPYFTAIKCDKWKQGCEKCSNSGRIDTSKFIFQRNKKLFTSVENMTIVTPSAWLAQLTGKSFLGKYPIKVINNGIDLTVFYPRESGFREKSGIEKKYILLGVAYGWGYRKGLDCFCELAHILDDSYQIVLVGTNEEIDLKLPHNIISIHRTANVDELAQIYSSADLFVNPTREDNFPTTNIEALACGIPVVTYETGGSPEIADKSCGCVVPYNDMNALVDTIAYIRKEKPFSKEACVRRAKLFDKEQKFREYISLYHEVIEREKNRDSFA